ncbi:hypothetical protein MKX03_022096 [Papaver bracteatum]|nr:hypothetical protein MKX03_022096 [Papaver bracteatum]
MDILPLIVENAGNNDRSAYSSLNCPPSRVMSRTFDMDGGVAPSLFPLHRCKILHLVRHAQGVHNVEAEKDDSAYLSYSLFDAPLTPLGWQQVDNFQNHVHDSGLIKKIELVVLSPMLRTMQTAVGIFGGGGNTDGMDIITMMVANAVNDDRSAYSSLNCPPFAAAEIC